VRPDFIEEKEAVGIHASRTRAERGALLADVGPVVFGGPEDFFFTVSVRPCSARQMVDGWTGTSSRSRSSANVASGCSCTRTTRRARCGGVILVQRGPPEGRAAKEPVSRRRWSKRRIHAVETPNSVAMY
jgi:hypothetical protein